jgi:hypothetical protein
MSDVTCGNLEWWATWGSFLSSCDKYGATFLKLILWMFVQLACDMCSNNPHHLWVGVGLFHTSLQDFRFGGIVGSIYSCLGSINSNVLFMFSLHWKSCAFHLFEVGVLFLVGNGL